MDVQILGEVVGSATGFDIADDFAIQFYDFKPNEKFSDKGLLEGSCVIFNFISGEVTYVGNEDGITYNTIKFKGVYT